MLSAARLAAAKHLWAARHPAEARHVPPGPGLHRDASRPKGAAQHDASNSTPLHPLAHHARPRLVFARRLLADVDAGVEDDRLEFAIGHAQRLGAREAAQRDLARRSLPRFLVGAPPAVIGPVADPRILERRA